VSTPLLLSEVRKNEVKLLVAGLEVKSDETSEGGGHERKLEDKDSTSCFNRCT
jgi:hypothetical protein